MNTTRWNGWGDPQRAMTLPEPMLDLLLQVLGATARRSPASVAVDQLRLPDPHIPATSLSHLGSIVGSEHILTSTAERMYRTRGKSTVDLLRIRQGDASDAPDAVVRPAS